MANLRGYPWFLQQADSVVIKVAAQNLVGWSEFSALSLTNALMEDVPHKPLASPLRDDILTSDILLQVTWATFNNPEDGGATIISYHLQYDDASDSQTWTDLVGLSSDEISDSFGVTATIQKDHTYRFRYRAKNVHGWGAYSDELSLIAARRADKPAPVVTSNEETDVKIAWTEPDYNGGSPLLGYRITI